MFNLNNLMFCQVNGSSLFGCFIVVRHFKTVREMAMWLHSTHLNMGFIPWSWFKRCVVIFPPLYAKYRNQQELVFIHEWHNCAQRLEKKHSGSHSSQNMYSKHVLWDGAAAIITKLTYKWCLGIIVVIIPIHVFFSMPPTSSKITTFTGI